MVNRSTLVIIGVSVGLALGLLIALIAFVAIKWYQARAHLWRCANEQSVTDLPVHTASQGRTHEFNTNAKQAYQRAEDAQKASPNRSWWNHRGRGLTASASGIPRYSYKDIQKATQNFTTILGEGSFGPVYKAIMPDGGLAAVKVHASNSTQGDKEFQTEVSLLGRLHHRNLVNLVGDCVERGQMMLIYEFMSNGSLEKLLHSEENRVLSWEERLQIALDISHGIEYLHEGAVPPVIHRDLKSANILLDYSMRAKVADFGLSKEMVFDGRNSSLKGTYGYMDPAYISTNKFTMKSDVYSFGVIIFELITSIHPQQNLMEYVNLASMNPDGIDEILDQKLVGKCSIIEVRELAKVANKCVRKVPRKRPSMVDVTQAILKIKQQWHRTRQDTISSDGEDLSRVLSRIEDQHVELSILAGVKEED